MANASSASVIMTSENLTRGQKYYWKALYQDTTGRISPYTFSDYYFHVNALPNTPSNILPDSSGGIYSIKSGMPIIFQAQFTDQDDYEYLDYPTGWYIIIEGQDANYNWSTAYTKSIDPSTKANLRFPTHEWLNTDYAISENTLYQWRTYFRDSQGEAGAYSQSNAFIISSPPNGTFSSPIPSTPNSPSTQTTLTPTLYWNYSGAEQYSYSIRIEELNYSQSILFNQEIIIPGTLNQFEKISSLKQYTFSQSDGYFVNGKMYKVVLTVKDIGGMIDPSPSIVYLYFNANAPSGISNVRSDAGNGYSIIIEWDKGIIPAGHVFSYYKIYRKPLFDTQWSVIAKISNHDSIKYEDWYAGNNIKYIYKVTQTTSTGSNAEFESSDTYLINMFSLPLEPGQVGNDVVSLAEFSSTAEGFLDGDVWQFIPADRNRTYMQELPVIDSSYNKVIQQESFETLGSNRKTIIRGFVLGDEGSISCVWKNEDVPSPADAQVYINETILGRRLLDYISRNKGPHILKSPFGDVWDVQFEGPEISWAPGGILQASVSWVETGTSGEESI